MTTSTIVDIWPILKNWTTGRTPTPEQWRRLIQWELADQRRARAWGITSTTIESKLQQRAQLLKMLADSPVDLPVPNTNFSSLIPLLWRLWLPLALWLVETKQTLDRPLIQGILGGQGVGKTTLTRSLGLILRRLGYRTVSLSIDDLYKSYRDRCELRKQDPRLIWRGPPGTHDIDLGLQTLQHLRQPTPGQAISIPRFDKSAHSGEGDRTDPEMVSDIDIVLFEGWFVGTRPIDPTLFASAPAPIETEHDRQFARDMNQGLNAYLPLWNLLDRLILLYPQDYRLCQRWRQQAEKAMKATGRAGMSNEAIDEFVEYFWKALHPTLFIDPLLTNPEVVDLVIEIRPDHNPANVYSPE
ncbi:MAG: glycerate kinase [Leptolyngbyaceae cyanobacterium MO_188.B28]|nr:glycerate kinase [Leptolyngbyaceae cyanobacterium MO_188.B28]